MKKQILIIEDNYYRFYAIKQVVESQLRLATKVVGSNQETEIFNIAQEFNPANIIFKPKGGVVDVLEALKKMNANRRNSEIFILATPELGWRLTNEIETLTASRKVRGNQHRQELTAA